MEGLCRGVVAIAPEKVFAESQIQQPAMYMSKCSEILAPDLQAGLANTTWNRDKLSCLHLPKL